MPDYILEPIDTDPDAILQELTEYIQGFYPDWEPSQGQLDYLIARFISLKAATIADMASRVLRGIYTYFGSSIVNIQPTPGASAQVSTTWTAINTLGPYTIDAGTEFGILDALNELHLFTTDAVATIPFGSSTVSDVLATSTEEGVDGNTLSGLLQPVEQIDWLSTASTMAPSSGGIDAESETDYLNRLTANLGLMAPRPILARDYALLSRNITGIWRAIGLDNYLPGTNEEQRLDSSVGAGTFTMSFGGNTTGSLVWNATAAQVKAALEGLASIEVGSITVTGGPAGTLGIFITFVGPLAYTNVAAITIANSGGANVTITTTVAGVASNAAADRAVVVAGIDVDGNAISPALKTELDAYLQSLREQNFIINVIDPAYSTIDVTFTGTKKVGADAADVEARAEQAVLDFLDSSVYGVPFWPPDARGWERKDTLYLQDLYTVLNNVDGFDHANTLTFSKTSGGTQDGTDKVLGGVFPLVRPGVVAGTVT